MDWLQAIVLAIVQGVTEFLPVSSAAHLILVPVLTPWDDQGLAFDVALHVGSLAAVVGYFRRELAGMAVDWLGSLRGRGLTADARLAWAVGLGTIPVGLAGLAFREQIELLMRSPVVLATSLIGFGLLLGWADWRWRGKKSEYDIGWREVAVIALAQALALIPGTSRSGVTMTAALLLGFSRRAAARYSFLLAIPIIALAGAYQTLQLLRAPPETVDWLQLGAGAAIAGIAAWLSVHWFLKLIERIGMLPFVVYRLILGAILLWIFL